MPSIPEENYGPFRNRQRKRRRTPSKLTYLLSASLVLFLVALLALALTRCAAPAIGGETPSPTVPVATATPTPTPSEVVAPSPSLTPPALPSPEPTPVATYDFTVPVPESEAVGADYFADAVFIGDSRTDGLKLYGGIEGADFIEHTGITVFEVGDKKVIRIDGQKYTVLEALAMKQYKKVYIALGVNELGYFNNEGFKNEYAGFVDQVRAIQPNAIIYLQTLVAINPDKAKANSQPYYITNEQIAIYNDIISGIAADKHVALADVNTGLTDENGILLRENSTDGIHFTKDHYKTWYEYLKTHTADEESYRAAQAG